MVQKTVRMISLFAAWPHKVEEFKFFLHEVIGPSLKQAGCLHYELQKNISQENEFNFIEEWEGRVTFDQVRRAHLKEGLESLGEFVTVGPGMRR